MKTRTIIAAVIGLGLCSQARSESLSTMDGATYNNITAQRADPDGLYIEYTPPGGGLGLSKVKFSRLSADQQKQFGYDPAKARDFEAKVVKATDDWRQESVRLEQAAKARQLADQTREDQQERTAIDRVMAMAQLKQAEAELMRSTEGSGNYGWSSFGGGGYGLVALPQIAGEQHNDHHNNKTDDTQPHWHPIFPGIDAVHASRSR